MNLVIIGNGFDKAHGLNTSYAQFRDYLKSNDNEEYNFLGQLFGEDFFNDKFWWNFEESLAKYNFENFTDDVEANMAFFHKNEMNEDEQIEGVKRYFTEHIDTLKKDFCNWIKYINEHELECVNKINMIVNVLSGAKVLSFNYTSTVEQLYACDCYHIHGFIENTDFVSDASLDQIILGHNFNIGMASNDGDVIDINKVFLTPIDGGESIPFNEIIMRPIYDSSNDENINNLLGDASANFESIFTKRTNKLIRTDNTGFFEDLKNFAKKITNVYILGHSLAEVDSEYFKKINEILNKYNIKPQFHASYYFNTETKEDNKKELLEKLTSYFGNVSVDFFLIN